MERVLIVDDDSDIRQLLSHNLIQAGFDVICAANGRDGLKMALDRSPSVVILDLMLPDIDGNEVCRAIHKTMSQPIPILMLTARGEEIDRVLGFELGADDYVTKPFSPREVILRVKALLRRTSSPTSEILEIGVLKLDLGRRHCLVGASTVDLTAKEFDLVHELMKAKGNVLTRQYLMDHVWGYDSDSESRTLDTHVRRLRDKLGKEGRRLQTVRGVGYRFDTPELFSGD